MKVLVCFKTIPDMSLVAGQDWATAHGPSIDLSFVRQIFNCYDESALELALKLSDQAKTMAETVDLTALTIDDTGADLFLKHLLAVQYDTAVRICPDDAIDLRFNALAVSRLISLYVKRTGHQTLVILGTRGSVGDNGQTGFFLAEHLGWPCIRNVTNLEPTRSFEQFEITSRVEGGGMELTISLPGVLIMGNATGSPYLRVPTLKQKLSAAKKKRTLLSFSDLGVDPAHMAVTRQSLDRLSPEPLKPSCTLIEGSCAQEKAIQLYDRYLKQRLEK